MCPHEKHDISVVVHVAQDTSKTRSEKYGLSTYLDRSLAELSTYFGLSMYLYRTFGQRIVKSKSEVAHCEDSEVPPGD